MKKMFFTAIALVALTGTSMANTKEVKKELPTTKKTVSLKERTYCDQVWINGYEYALIVLHYAAGSDDAWDYADERATALGC